MDISGYAKGIKRQASATEDAFKSKMVKAENEAVIIDAKRPRASSSGETSQAITGKENYSENLLEGLLGREIPYPMEFPWTVPISENCSSLKLVALGVETTSLELDCDIIQLTCADLNNEESTFSCYIKPDKEIDHFATDHNGLTFMRGKLRQNGKKVKAKSLEKGLKSLIQHLKENTVLISHNTEQFQARRLMHKISSLNLEEPFMKKVVGFIDSYSLYLKLYPKGISELESHKLYKIVEHFSCDYTKGKGNFEQPSKGEENLVKIKNLAHLICYHNLTDGKGLQMLYQHSITVTSAIKLFRHLDMTYTNAKTFKCLVGKKLLSKMIARNMASSGLTLQCLEIAYQKAQYDGLLELLIPRITKTTTVVKKLLRHFGPREEDQMPFEPLVKAGLLSKNMARKMARSGITLRKLKAAYGKAQYDGLSQLLAQKITKNTNVVKNIQKYFDPTPNGEASFEPLLKKKLLSKIMAKKMASVGITLQSLEAAYEKAKYDGLLQLLSQKKITKSTTVIKNIQKYFDPTSDVEATFEPLLQRNLLTKKMAKKMASSSLTMQSLEEAYKTGQYEGLLELLKPRVTNSNNVVKKILLYFEPNTESGGALSSRTG